MSDVELLREAARLMRERGAAALTVGQTWSASTIGDDDGALVRARRENHSWTIAECDYPPHAEHIASWHPVVAMAVADWLEQWADHVELCETGPYTCQIGAGSYSDGICNGAALNVARLYLGMAPEKHVEADLSASDVGSVRGDVRDDDSGSVPQNGEADR